MDLETAILALSCGTPPERNEAKEVLGRYYLPRLAATITKHLFLDEDCATTGAAQALLDLFELSEHPQEDEALTNERLLWTWLLRRAMSRARDCRRRQRALVSGVPENLWPGVEAETETSDLDPADKTDRAPLREMIDSEERERVRMHALEFLQSLDDPIDRGIFLHDLTMKYGLLTQLEAEAFDEELISNTHTLYTVDRLKKRRQRLRTRLQEFFKRLQ